VDKHTKVNFVLWECCPCFNLLGEVVSSGCGYINQAVVIEGQALVEDRCESCGRILHEPLTEIVSSRYMGGGDAPHPEDECEQP